MLRSNRNENEYTRYKRKKVDFGVVFNFIVLNVVYTFSVFFVRKFILSSIAQSPAHRLGNEIISFREIHSTKVAFGLFQNQADVAVTVSFIAVALLFLLIVANSARLHQNMISAVAFLTSGMILTNIDRIMFGYVTDYIKLGVIPSLPMFNFADVMVFVGVVGVLNCIIQKQWFK